MVAEQPLTTRARTDKPPPTLLSMLAQSEDYRGLLLPLLDSISLSMLGACRRELWEWAKERLAGPRRRLRRGPASRVGGKLAIALQRSRGGKNHVAEFSQFAWDPP